MKMRVTNVMNQNFEVHTSVRSDSFWFSLGDQCETVLNPGTCLGLIKYQHIHKKSHLKSGLLQPSDLSSLSAGRSTAGPIQMSLNIF